MTPKEKARELFYKFYNEMNPYNPDCNLSINQCKECSIIAVDEIINNCLFEFYSCGFLTLKTKHKEYWDEVKNEIEKL
jgi:hypothetical protein